MGHGLSTTSVMGNGSEHMSHACWVGGSLRYGSTYGSTLQGKRRYACFKTVPQGHSQRNSPSCLGADLRWDTAFRFERTSFSTNIARSGSQSSNALSLLILPGLHQQIQLHLSVWLSTVKVRPVCISRTYLCVTLPQKVNVLIYRQHAAHVWQ